MCMGEQQVHGFGETLFAILWGFGTARSLPRNCFKNQKEITRQKTIFVLLRNI